VVHTGGGRRRGRSRPRILYWFRTPPGVRIGRSALDEAAIRLIEEHNPDVEFDWTRILKGQDASAEQKAPPQERRRRPRPEYPSRQEAAPPAAPMPSRHQVEPATVEPAAEPLSETAQPDSIGGSTAETPHSDAPAPTVAEPRLLSTPSLEEQARIDHIDQAAIDELLSDLPALPSSTGVSPDEPATPAEARLGSEGLSRLRARHAEVLARISETVTDPMRRDELKSQAERLNPDTWVTDAEVTLGLESYETVFESLRTVVGRGRKRRRRSAGRPKADPGSTALPKPDAASSEPPGRADGDADDGGEDL
jgi:hypothetical protein